VLTVQCLIHELLMSTFCVNFSLFGSKNEREIFFFLCTDSSQLYPDRAGPERLFA
jgi:hypothetical protein